MGNREGDACVDGGLAQSLNMPQIMPDCISQAWRGRKATSRRSNALSLGPSQKQCAKCLHKALGNAWATRVQGTPLPGQEPVN